MLKDLFNKFQNDALQVTTNIKNVLEFRLENIHF